MQQRRSVLHPRIVSRYPFLRPSVFREWIDKRENGDISASHERVPKGSKSALLGKRIVEGLKLEMLAFPGPVRSGKEEEEPEPHEYKLERVGLKPESNDREKKAAASAHLSNPIGYHGCLIASEVFHRRMLSLHIKTEAAISLPLTIHTRACILSSMNRLSTAERARVVAVLVEGNGLRATARITGVARMTVEKLLRDLGAACARFHDQTVRSVRSKRIQCDEIWSFVYAKEKNAPEAMKAAGLAGDVWTWTAIDADSRLMVSWLVGGRDAGYAWVFMQDVASRLTNRVQLTTDGHKPYLMAVEDAFGADVDYATLTKLYGAAPEGQRRYSPPQYIRAKRATITGRPDPRHVSTSYVERQNLTMRMHMRRFTRLTNGFSKKVEMHEHNVALHFTYYNFCKVHMTLRVTPAMEAGLTDHVWGLDELVGLLESHTARVA